MSLRLDDTVQRYLLSTTSRMIGEFELDGLYITHAWPGRFNQQGPARSDLGPASRNTFVVSFKTERTPKAAGAMIPDYSYFGDRIASILSLLFGKRFDQHGLLEGSGLFQIPDLSHFATFCIPALPHNSHAVRVDYPVPLNLGEIQRIVRLWGTPAPDPRFLHTFYGAATFYHQAIENFDRDPEVAYLHLITAGEILSNFTHFETDELLDEQTKTHLQTIRSDVKNGDKIARQLSGRMRQIKRRFIQTILRLVDDEFFTRSECTQSYGRFTGDSSYFPHIADVIVGEFPADHCRSGLTALSRRSRGMNRRTRAL
jgi:hypothetical protein